MLEQLKTQQQIKPSRQRTVKADTIPEKRQRTIGFGGKKCNWQSEKGERREYH